jgi:hypothetical protein
MTDRELLELAAKAAGIEYNFICPNGAHCGDMNTMQNRFWNPLEDDGDALRLAVKLGLACSPGGQVFTYDDDLMSAWADKDVMYGTDFCQHVQWSKSNGDPYAATRRAIVRAAAEIGKEMK